MAFQVGDQVVHRVYGLGEVIQLDEKTLAGRTDDFYVVRIRDLTLWVRVSDGDESSLRYPTPAGEFKNLFAILSGPGNPLSNDRFERKTQLTDQLKDGKLISICQVIRDLTFRRRTQKMNDNDKAVLERTQNFLLTEWALSLATSISQAKHDLNDLLGEEMPTRI